MANEISLQFTLNVQNPSSPLAGTTPFSDKASDNLSLTQATLGESAGVMSVPTTAGGTVLPVGGVSTNGYAFFKNLDATNYVQIGIKVTGTFYAVLKLKPNESGVIRIDPSAALYCLANTAAVNLQYKLFQD